MMILEEDQYCVECLAQPTVMIGESPDFCDSKTINICLDCLKEAIKLLDKGWVK